LKYQAYTEVLYSSTAYPIFCPGKFCLIAGPPAYIYR
jgi:hypothetical protein